jgi:DNA polymerase-3 subunit beta
MEVSINSKELLDAIKVVGACVKQKNTMPILDCLLFEFSQGKLVITADNLEIRTSVTLEFKFKGELSVCINYKMLLDVLSSLPNSPIKMSFSGSLLTISLKSGVYTIPTESGDLFTVPAEIDETESIKINGPELSEALKNACMFVPVADLDNLSNIFLEATKSKTVLYSSDKAIIFNSVLNSEGDGCVVAFSKEIAKYLISALSKEEEVEIKFSKSHIVLQLEGHSISAILSEVQQPPFHKLFESVNPESELRFDREAFYASVKRLSQISDDTFRVLVLDIDKKSIGISFENIGTKLSAKEVLDCQFSGEPMKIGFKATYLLNVMTALSSETEICIKLSSPQKPCLISVNETNIILAPIKL